MQSRRSLWASRVIEYTTSRMSGAVLMANASLDGDAVLRMGEM